MSRGRPTGRTAAVRAIGGERNATRAEQLRARGRSDRTIAWELGIDREVLAHWFDLQDALVLGSDLDGAA